MKIACQKTLLAILVLVLLAAAPMSGALASQQAAAPRNLLSVTADLSKNGSQLYMYVRFLFISAETTYYSVRLQQYVNGEWSTWSADSDVRFEQAFVYAQYASPPKGYYYRLMVVGSSPSFPGFEFYSNEVFY